MWFKKNKQPSSIPSIEQLLSQLNTDGIHLSIEELLSYQGKSGLIDLAPKKAVHSKLAGNYLARSKGRGMEFDEVRHYQNGDDIRAIDWRVTARTGKTHTKLFREEVERPVLVATDLSASMQFGSQLLFKSVQASHLAAVVSWHAKKRGDRLGGLVFTDNLHSEVKPRSRKQGVLHYLHSLIELHQSQTSVEQSSAQSFVENCARLRQIARPGALVYVISDFSQLNDEAIRHLSHISRHCELIACQISDPIELSLPSSKQQLNLAITDGQLRQDLIVGNTNVNNDYQRQAELINEIKAQGLLKAGARHLHFSAGTSLEQQLKDGGSLWIH